jgi:RNA polymerase sigma factor (sigma-70 family)
LQLISWDDIAPEQHVVINPMLQPETSLLKTEEAQAVQSLIQTLNPDYRALVILKYWSDLTYDEIGLIYGLTTSAVKSKLFRARRALARAAHRPQSASDPRSRSPLPVPV